MIITLLLNLIPLFFQANALFFTPEEQKLIQNHKLGSLPGNCEVSAFSYQDATSWFIVMDGVPFSPSTQESQSHCKILKVTPTTVVVEKDGAETNLTLHPHQTYTTPLLKN